MIGLLERPLQDLSLSESLSLYLNVLENTKWLDNRDNKTINNDHSKHNIYTGCTLQRVKAAYQALPYFLIDFHCPGCPYLQRTRLCHQHISRYSNAQLRHSINSNFMNNKGPEIDPCGTPSQQGVLIRHTLVVGYFFSSEEKVFLKKLWLLVLNSIKRMLY